jgi:hypothetical protein
MGMCMCQPSICCNQRQSCYRYRMIPNEYRQAYAHLYEQHPSDPSIKCINFVAIEGRRIAPPKF